MNRHFAIVPLAALLLLSLATLPQATRASEARSAGLAGNPMVLDMVDIPDFPGLVTAEGNSLFLNVYNGSPYGNAGFLIGENLVAGAWINRQAKWQDLEKTDEIFGFDLPTVHDLFDLYLGTGFGLGFRLSLSAGLNASDSRSVSNSANLYADGASVFSVEFAPGFTIERPSYHGDIGLGASISHYKVSQNGELAYTSGYIPSFFLRHRSIIGHQTRTANWVIDFYFTRRAYTAKAQGITVDEGSFGHIDTTLVVGPKFNLPHDLTIWGGLKLELEYLSGGLSVTQGGGGILDIPQPRSMGISAPGVVLSAELMPLDFLFIRAGVDYDLYWTIDTQPDVGDADGDGDRTEPDVRDRALGHRFSWSTGLGVALGDFEVDGTVTQMFWFNGPQVIGGGDPGFLGMLSATYMW